MKKKIASLLLMLLCGFSAYTQAEMYDNCCCEDSCCEDTSNFYAEVFGGANFLQTEKNGGIKSDFQTGYIVSGSLGYNWRYGLRLEAEYAFRRNQYRKVHFFGRSFHLHGHFQSSSYMANLLWDLPLCNWGIDLWNITPFIGGGIGYDCQQLHAKNEGLIFNTTAKGFAWQVLAGLGYPITCNMDISVEYKFHQGRFCHLYNHSVGVGLTYKFGSGF